MGGFGGGGFSMAASQSLRNNRSLRRGRGSYFKKRNSEAQRYLVPKASNNSYLLKREMELKSNQKLWKVWIITGLLAMILTWWLVQFY